MKIEFQGDISDLSEGISCIKEDLGIELSKGGLIVEVIKADSYELELFKDNNYAKITYGRKIHFFRALSLLKENESKSKIHISERQQFDMCGAMFDMSQGNAVIKTDNVKRILRKMALMGLDMIMLYTEDNYQIKGEPYFGYMRGKYSFEELKAIDDYAYALGIEAIPCIQTLAHLYDALRWKCFETIKEDDDTLLVGDDKTYEFIEKMIATASAPFRSKRIHIGMDEAWKLGQGNYLLKNGYSPKYQIMREHLDKVLKITEKYNLKPFIWCDMFFRSIADNLYHSPDIVLPQEVIASVPEGVELMGWEYYQFGADNYERYFAQHKRLSDSVSMAGGIWSWSGYVAEYDKTFLTSNYFLNAAKKTGIRKVMATIWGDYGTESNVYSTLLGLQLFAEHNYLSSEPSPEKIKIRFKACTGCEFDDFYEMTYIDKYDRMQNPEGYTFVNSSKALIWQDILAGLFDKHFEDTGFDLSEYYAERTKRMKEAIGRNGEFDGIFEFMMRLCHVLEIKADAGIKLHKAYKENDREVLERYSLKLLPELFRRVEELRNYNYAQWMEINKPFGWEVLDIRYGGLLARIQTATKRLKAYLSGEISVIEELDEEQLYYNGKPGLFSINEYSKIVSASRL